MRFLKCLQKSAATVGVASHPNCPVANSKQYFNLACTNTFSGGHSRQVHCRAYAPPPLMVWAPLVACRVRNLDHYGAPTTRAGNQVHAPDTESARPASPQADQLVHKMPLWESLGQ